MLLQLFLLVVTLEPQVVEGLLPTQTPAATRGTLISSFHRARAIVLLPMRERGPSSGAALMPSSAARRRDADLLQPNRRSSPSLLATPAERPELLPMRAAPPSRRPR